MDKLVGLRRLLLASWGMVNLMFLAFMSMYAKVEALEVIKICAYGVIIVTILFFGQRVLEPLLNRFFPGGR